MAKGSASNIRAGRAYVELFADDSKLVRGLKSAQRRLTAFGAAVGAAGAKLMGVGTAIMAPLAISGKLFADFEQQMANVSTMLDEPEKFMGQFAAGVERLSTEMGESTETLAKGLYDILSASVPAGQAIDYLAVAAKAAKGGMTTTAVAVDGLTSIMNAFQVKASDVAHVSDMMFATVKGGKITFEQLASNIGKVAPMAQAAGMSMEDMLATVATMTRQGLSAEESTTRLVNILKQFPEAGKNIRGLIESFKGKSLQEIMETVPEIRAAGGIAALAADLEGLDRDLAAMANSAGVAEAAFKKMDATTASGMAKVKQSVIAAAVSVGEALAPSLKQASEWILKVLSHANEWIKKNQGVIVTILQVAAGAMAAGAALIALSFGIKGVAFAIGGLTTILGVLRVAAVSLYALLGAMLTPIGAVITAVAAMGGIFLYASGTAGKAIDWLGGAFKVLAEDASDSFRAISAALAAGDIGAAAKVLWTLLKMEWAKGVNILMQVWVGFSRFFSEQTADAFYGAQAIWVMVSSGIQSGMTKLTTALADGWNTFCWAFRAAWEATASWLKKSWNDLKGIFDGEFNPAAANRAIDDASRAEQQRILDESVTKERQIAADKTKRLKEIEEGRFAALAAIGGKDAEEQRQREEAYRKQLAAAQADLAKARAEWEDARKKALTIPKERGLGAPPGSSYDPNEVMKKIKFDLENLTKLGGGSTTAGTFNAAAIQGLAGGRAVDRIAKATEQTVKNTNQTNKIIRDLPNFGGSSFA